MRRIALGLVCVLGLTAGAQAADTKREEWQESAKEMGFGPCPARVRSEAGIDSTQDWRVYVDLENHFRYCVPAWWTTRRPQPVHPDRVDWKEDKDGLKPYEGLSVLVTGRLSVPIGAMYPADYPEGTRRGMWMGLIGGVKAETWGDKKSVVALFRSKEVKVNGYSLDRATAEMQRQVIKSIRFESP